MVPALMNEFERAMARLLGELGVVLAGAVRVQRLGTRHDLADLR